MFYKDSEEMIGKTVKLTGEFKQLLMQELKDKEDEGCPNHVTEFGDCVGVVEGLVDYGSSKGPEVDVRWKPAGWRYAYHPRDLEVVTTQNIGG